MDSSNPATWSVQTTDTTPSQQLGELVMAWGKDTQTGEARYIFELDQHHKGARSGCVCYSCGKPLTAVNAATDEWEIRPHFRHPPGAERTACLVLTARAAALSLLKEKDYIVLPARRVNKQVVGITGKAYNAWVSLPAQRVSIKSFNPRDQVSAVLTLEDGRQVLVRLTGSLQGQREGEVMPVIELVVDDPALAAMDPDTLKAKLHLLVEAGTWCGQHWADVELGEQARLQAEEAAADALDWLPKEAVAELGGFSSQESVLHWLTKEILRQEGRLQVPAVVYRELWAGSREPREIARRPGSLLQLSDVRLERKVGQIRPDVVAKYVDPFDGTGGVLLVEVTVTNEIVPERLARIQAEGKAALEINIGQLGGSLTRQDFTRLVTEELTVKRWLHHPWLVDMAAHRQAQSDEARRQFDIDLAETRAQYLAAVRHLADLRAQDLDTPEARQARNDGLEVVRKLGEELALYGCEGADDKELYGWQGCILDRLLSIHDGKPVGYQRETLWQVVHTATLEKAPDKVTWHTLYLWALVAYPVRWAPHHQEHIDRWRKRVWSDLKQSAREGRKSAHLRDRKFDPLLWLLFPELRQHLEVPLPGERNAPALGQSMQPVRGSQEPGLPPPRPRTSRGWWLAGEDLEKWRLQYPEAARFWDAAKRP